MDICRFFCYNLLTNTYRGIEMLNNKIAEIKNSRILKKINNTDMDFRGTLLEAVRFIERNQICDVGLWKKFVEVFRAHGDGVGETLVSWRSEYWGKMMRGASMITKYTKNNDIYRILLDSVRDILTAEDELGRISGYSKEEEFDRWDLWGRKYVMLGMMYFMEICDDEELNSKILSSMRRQADYIIGKIGKDKLDIRTCSKNWEGLNSCSILEPIVRLYRLTGEKKYLDFAEYIIDTGFVQSGNLIELAYKDEIPPSEYPVVKAYEMMSCFEGLLQYYCITGNEKYKSAVVNLGHRIIKEELSIIGSSGCEFELFDHTSTNQTVTSNETSGQETCVTVTWMKLAAALLELTGEVAFADSIENSYYNAYRGAFNTERNLYKYNESDAPQVLPFDSYSPLTAKRRGITLGGYNYFPDRTFYGCCAAIGAAGAGVIPEIAVMKCDTGAVINYYEEGIINTTAPSGEKLKINIDTDYPYDEKINIRLELDNPESFELRLRIPEWCDVATVSYGNEKKSLKPGYASLLKEWKNNDEITVYMPMAVKEILPPSDAVNSERFSAYKYGPIMLAADKRIADPDKVYNPIINDRGEVLAKQVYCPEIKEAHICFELQLKDGGTLRLIDYASAGKTWSDDSRMAVWIGKSDK